jgi:hypothetical protein
VHLDPPHCRLWCVAFPVPTGSADPGADWRTPCHPPEVPPGWRELLREFVDGDAASQRPVRDRDLHRWFAVELNNTLWDALDAYAPPEPLAEPERVLYQAYAACFHWLHAGTVVNHGRGVRHRLGRPGRRDPWSLRRS